MLINIIHSVVVNLPEAQFEIRREARQAHPRVFNEYLSI